MARDTDTPAAARLFVGAMQGLVMRSLLEGEIECIRANTPEILKILLRSVERPISDMEGSICHSLSRKRDDHG